MNLFQAGAVSAGLFYSHLVASLVDARLAIVKQGVREGRPYV